MQGGRLRVDDKQAAKPRNGQARWVFADGRALLLTEAGTERKAGAWVVEADPETQEPITGLGPDAEVLEPDALGPLPAPHPMRPHGRLPAQRTAPGPGRPRAHER